MKIPPELIFSNKYPAGEIRIDSTFRLGRPVPGKNRSISIKLLTKISKDIVLDRRFTANLKKGGYNISVSQQFPSVTREKRSAQISTLKSLKESAQPNDKIVLIKDQIHKNGKHIQTDFFEKGSLPGLTPLSIDYAKINHSEKTMERGSTFQAHTVSAINKYQLSAARHALFQSEETAQAEHTMYAYKIESQFGKPDIGYSDDGELQGGKILLQVLEEHNLTNIFLAVTRRKDGPNLGRRRFDLIKETAEDVLKQGRTDIDTNILYNTIIN